MRRIWKQILSLAMALSLFCGIIAPTPAMASASGRADAAQAVNGHRDTFISTEAGSLPGGFETKGRWGVVAGTQIPIYNAITTMSSNGTSYPYTREENWSHFLRRESGSAFAVYENSYTDFDCTTLMMIPSGGTAGAVVFRYTDENNYYYYQLSTAGKATLGKVVNGENTVLGTKDITVNAGTWYNLRVTMKGNQIVTKINNYVIAYIDLKVTALNWDQREAKGVEIFNVTDDSLASGKVGYWSEGEGDASAQYCVFAVSNTAADHTMENSTFKVTTGPYGQIKELYLKSDSNTNFVSNEETHREDVGANHFLGEIIFTYKVNGTEYRASTGASDDTRRITQEGNKITVSYQTASAEAEGIRHFTVVETYTLLDDHLQFDIEITNTSGGALEILDLGLPMMWNNHWQWQSPYKEYASATGYYVSYNGSWIQIESAGGGVEKKDGGQKLLFLPDSSTGAKLEYRRYYSNEGYFSMAPETYYVYSKNISREGQGYLESTSKTLAANESEKLSFQLYATDSYLDTESKIYEAGSLDVQVNPGMVLPDDITAKVDIHTKKNVTNVELITSGKSAAIQPDNASSGDHKIYSIKFDNQGRNDVKITYDGGKQSVLQFWVTDSVNEAMQAHVDFLMNTLRITDPNDRHYGSFNEYNNVTNTVLTKVGDECSNNNYEQMYDGPALIAEKQVYYPVQNEIDAMDVYLIDLVYAKELVKDAGSEHYGRLYFGCEAPGFESYGNPKNVSYNGYTVTSRIFNYFRICNTFYSMYKAAAYYGDTLTFRWEPAEYLYWAGMLAAWGEEISGTTGVMGEQTVPDIIEALKKEGMTDLAGRLENAAKAKGQAVSRQAFPFGSEFSVDRTGEEGAYFLTKMIGHQPSQIKAVNKIMAWISKTPTWYQQTTGRCNDTDWWIFQYTVSLQAAALKDWYMTHEKADEYWSMIYPAAFSSFAHIKTSNEQESNGPTGTVWWNYWPTRPYDWSGVAGHSGGNWPNGQTGEADIDLWGGMQILSTDVVLNDPSFGLTAYGGTAERNEAGAVVVTPQDGLYTNLNVVGTGSEIELQSDKYSRAELTFDNNNQLTSLTLTLNNFRNAAHEAELTVSGLPAGSYQLTIDGSRQMTAAVDGNSAAAFTYQTGAGTGQLLKIEPCTATGKNVALIGDDALAGRGTSDWAAKGVAPQLKALLEAKGYTVQTFTGSFEDSAVTAFAPDMVVLMTDTVADCAGQIGKYQQLASQPVVYAVTTGNETAAGAVRTAAREKNAVLIDAWDLIGEQPDLVQDGALNNNGARALAEAVYTRITRETDKISTAGKQPYVGMNAVDFDRQSGAHYKDAKETAGAATEPYVHVDADGFIGFQGVEQNQNNANITLDGKFDSDGILQVYSGNPKEDGSRLVGQVNVTAGADFASVTCEVLKLTGPADLYLTANVGMDVKTVKLADRTESTAITITAGPANVDTHDGETATFTVAATAAEGGSLTYQWQKSTDEVIWADIDGATEATYTTGALSVSDDDGTYYRVVVKVGQENKNSAAAKLTVKPTPKVTSVTVSPAAASVRAGASQSFTAAVAGENDPSTEVTWTVTGGKTGTAIDAGGKLTVSADETAGTALTVRATSVYDATKYGEATVTVAQALSREDIVLHYLFNEGSGTTVIDYSNNQYDGTISGNVTTSWTADGYAFNGSSHVTPGQDARLVSSDMTLVYKIKRTGNITGASSLFWGMPYQTWNGQGMWLNFDGNLPLGVDTDGAKRYECSDMTTNEFYPLNEWVEVAVSVNVAGDLAIYRNGELAGSATGHTVTAPGKGYNTIGMAGYDNELLHNVTMGEYIIFDKALSEAEAKAVLADKFKPEEPVGPQEPVYSGISIDPTAISVRAGGEATFTSRVSGRYLPEDGQAVTWTLTGNNSSGTTLDDGVLKIAADETAGTLTVKVTSVKAASLSAEAQVTVYPAVTEVTKEDIRLHYIFDGKAGDAAVKDYSENGYNGDITGGSAGAAWVDGGYAYDGASFITPHANGGGYAQLLSPNMSVVFKVKRTGNFDYNSDGEGFFWFKTGWNSNGIYALAQNENTPLFVQVDSDTHGFSVTGWTVTDFYPLNEEVEIAITVDSVSGEYAVYRNGERVQTSVASGVAVTPIGDSQNVIGKAGYNNDHLNNITMSKFMVFDQVLTDRSAKDIYDGKFDPEVEPPVHVHTTSHVAAKAPTCTEAGNIEYWMCSGCGKFFEDAAGTKEITNVTLDATGHSGIYHVPNEPTETEAGNIEYWWCPRCQKYFSSADCETEITQAQTVRPATGHTTERHERVEPTDSVNGNIEYWTCGRCGKYFADANCTQEIRQADTVLFATGSAEANCQHTGGTTEERTEPTCTRDGQIVTICSVCQKTVSKSPLHALGHAASKTEAVDATCTASGKIAHWGCTRCGKHFSDEACTQEIQENAWEIPALGHTLIHHAPVEATENASGNTEYWKCSICGTCFSDAEGNTAIAEESTVIPPIAHTHQLTHHSAVAPTVSASGNIEYWHCAGCGKYFRDAVGSAEIAAADVILPPLENPVNPNPAPIIPGIPSTPSTPSTPSNPATPSTPGQSAVKVSTNKAEDTGTTTMKTTAIPDAVSQGNTSTSVVTGEMFQEIVVQAVNNESSEVIIAPEMDSGVTRAQVSVPASSVGEIGGKTSAKLQIATPVASVTIPNEALPGLAASGGQITVTAEKTEEAVEVTIAANGMPVANLTGGIVAKIAQADCGPGTVAMLVHEDGRRTVVRQSVASGDGQSILVPLNGSAKVVLVDNSQSFADVPASNWAAEAVAFVSSHELMKGTGEGIFNPGAAMTRGMLTMVLHNLENNPASTMSGNFSDVADGVWYSEAVHWAAEKGIVNGYADGSFGVADPISREQLAVMLYRYAGNPESSASIASFADANEVGSYAKAAVAWAVANGIMNGKGNGMLDPKGTATRAEVAQMLLNFLSLWQEIRNNDIPNVSPSSNKSKLLACA